MDVRITVTVCLENSMWVAIFESIHEEKLTAARVVFGKEPTDPELYEWLLGNYNQLNFSAPQSFKLTIKRKNPKRMLRDIKREMEKASDTMRKESFAQEVLRLDLERNKKIRKVQSKAEKEAEQERKFKNEQEKKKQKKRGH